MLVASLRPSIHLIRLSTIVHGRKRRTAMIKLSVISTFFGILLFWTSVLVEANPTITNPQRDPVSTPVALLLLGSGLSALAFWGKRPTTKK